jgi:hypothetical protein
MTTRWKIAAVLLLFLFVTTGIFARGSYEFSSEGFTEIPNLERFDGVVNTTAADVVVRVGDEYRVRAQGDPDILEQFEFEVRGGELRIRRPWRPWWFLEFRGERDVFVEISMPVLQSVTLTGSGDLRVEGEIHADDLSLRTTGSGSIDAHGQASSLEITMTGSGDTMFTGECHEADVRLSGSADLIIELEAEVIEARITGSGDIDMEGSAGRIELDLTGPGEFRGERFMAQIADVRITGSGEAFLAVEQHLTSRLTGSGDVILVNGDPTIESSRTGVGRVVVRK